MSPLHGCPLHLPLMEKPKTVEMLAKENIQEKFMLLFRHNLATVQAFIVCHSFHFSIYSISLSILPPPCTIVGPDQNVLKTFSSVKFLHLSNGSFLLEFSRTNKKWQNLYCRHSWKQNYITMYWLALPDPDYRMWFSIKTSRMLERLQADVFK